MLDFIFNLKHGCPDVVSQGWSYVITGNYQKEDLNITPPKKDGPIPFRFQISMSTLCVFVLRIGCIVFDVASFVICHSKDIEVVLDLIRYSPGMDKNAFIGIYVGTVCTGRSKGSGRERTILSHMATAREVTGRDVYY